MADRFYMVISGELDAYKYNNNLNKDVEVVNSIAFEDGYLALVIAKPAALEELGVAVLDLPEVLNGDVARPS